MYYSKYFEKFCRDKNISESTCKGYEIALKKYSIFHNKSIDCLIDEALDDESGGIALKNRKIKNRLLDFRSSLIGSDLSSNTVKTYFSKIRTFYRHFEIELPNLPDVKYAKGYESSYFDLPTRKHIKDALEIVGIDLKALILFMSSSGTAKAETLSLTVGDFIQATSEYHSGGEIREVLKVLENREVVPTFYLKRIKTDKYYYTFCSPEASKFIIKYLKTRIDIKLSDKLFDFSDSQLLARFQKINDSLGWGFKGNHRFFRSHTLRKFHASNIGLSAEYVDLLQGRGKTRIHETYIKTNPEKLKEIYKSVVSNVMIYQDDDEVKIQEFNIIINVFLSGKEYNIL